MEGPGLVLLKEKAMHFIGKQVVNAHGSLNINMDRLSGQKITNLKTWGKHFLIILENCTVRIHFLMFGNYYLNSRHPDKAPKFTLELKNGEWNNYNCAAKILEGTDMDALYDWSTDIMQDDWNSSQAQKKLLALPELLACDALLDQTIFSGVGNVTKNETLFRMKIHPNSKVGELSPKQIKKLIEEARMYCFDFYRWEKEGIRRKKYCVHRRAWCPDCKKRLTKEFTGSTPRSSFYCSSCQLLYA